MIETIYELDLVERTETGSGESINTPIMKGIEFTTFVENIDDDPAIYPLKGQTTESKVSSLAEVPGYQVGSNLRSLL
jgi:hypothetical protein